MLTMSFHLLTFLFNRLVAVVLAVVLAGVVLAVVLAAGVEGVVAAAVVLADGVAAAPWLAVAPWLAGVDVAAANAWESACDVLELSKSAASENLACLNSPLACNILM